MPPTTTSPQRKWLGVLLSLFIPGFGLLRAGLPRRAVAWFLGLYATSLILGVCCAWSAIPFTAVVIVAAALVVAQLWMLRDSFKPGRMTWQLGVLFVGLLAVLLLVPTPVSLVIRPFKIPTAGMEPTLRGNQTTTSSDHIVVDRLSYRFKSPQRGDLIVFSTSKITGLRRDNRKTDDEVFFIKRLVGLPGERISIVEGKIFADGKLLGEADGIPSSLYFTEPVYNHLQNRQSGDEFAVGKNKYFVLGDNSANSYDSRYWGGVPVSAVYGKVSMIYYPFTRAGRLTESSTE